jgi:hypothetical protein
MIKVDKGLHINNTGSCISGIVGSVHNRLVKETHCMHIGISPVARVEFKDFEK